MKIIAQKTHDYFNSAQQCDIHILNYKASAENHEQLTACSAHTSFTDTAHAISKIYGIYMLLVHTASTITSQE